MAMDTRCCCYYDKKNKPLQYIRLEMKIKSKGTVKKERERYSKHETKDNYKNQHMQI